ncbi:DUF2391 family protein [Halobacterium jilantaiense]|uniref:Putative integral membrane protein n=1 Tax=Halobacterium jilantaiense TaxID=355548 RepID=A0A1I0QSZ1_9EURY|nr:DUF2391 family protein [Halobacterium jilantaiense]SEW30740.1 Putative integral membrane protein [Halobacterium jilantaiense]
MSQQSGAPDPADDADRPDLSDLFDELEDLDDHVDSEEARTQLREAKEVATGMRSDGTFGQVIYGFDRTDAAEAALGSLLFGIPMAVEGGTNEAGAFVAQSPWLLAALAVATVAIVHSVLYVAAFQDVRVADPLLGFVPRRLAGVLAVSLGTAAVLLTSWGRLAGDDPVVALGTVLVAWVPMAIGAALGDILPGS